MKDAEAASAGAGREEQNTTAPRAAMPEEPTVGTGSAVAVGCVVATLLIMIVGVLLVLWLR